MTVSELMLVLQRAIEDGRHPLGKHPCPNVVHAIAVGDSLRIETTNGDSYTLRVTSKQTSGRCVRCNCLTGMDTLPGAEMCKKCHAEYS